MKRKGKEKISVKKEEKKKRNSKKLVSIVMAVIMLSSVMAGIIPVMADPLVVSLDVYTPDPTDDNTPTYTGNATDATENITSVLYYVGGSGPFNATAVDGAFDSQNESFHFTASTLPDGTRLFEVIAYNAVGNWSYANDTLTIDTTPPVVSLDVYTPDPTNDSTPTYTGNATDATTNITDVRYYVNGIGPFNCNCC